MVILRRDWIYLVLGARKDGAIGYVSHQITSAVQLYFIVPTVIMILTSLPLYHTEVTKGLVAMQAPLQSPRSGQLSTVGIRDSATDGYPRSATARDTACSRAGGPLRELFTSIDWVKTP